MKSKRFVALAAAFAVAASAMTGFTLTASAEDTEAVYNFSSLTDERYSKSGASVFDGALTLTGTEDAKPQAVTQTITSPLGSSVSVTSALMSKQLGVKLHLAAGETVVEYYAGCDSKLAGKAIDVVVKNAAGTAVATENNAENSAFGVYKISYTAAEEGDYTIVDSGTSTNRTVVFAVAVTNGTYDANITPPPSSGTTAPDVTATATPTAAPQTTVDPNAASDITITKAQGWQESAYITWTNPTTVSGYNVYVKKTGGTYTKIDKELTRYYGSYYRADALGLAAGIYQMKVVPVLNGAEVTADAKESEEVTVSSYIREGFAFDSHSSHYNAAGVGAYKNDGTLKDGAKVLYITDKNKNTVTMDVVVDKNKGTVNTGTGLVEILSLREKNNAETTPLAIRMIGQVEAPAGINSAKYAQIKATSNITFEGVGDDATTYHWSLLIRDTNNIEVRNIAVMEFYDDGISLDTDNFNDWVHNCDIFYGQNRGGDQKKGDGSLDVKSGSDYCTFSYNHFWDSGKCSLCGMKEDSYKGYHITYFGNWFDHSDSRHPRVRGDQVHVYNNYYDGVAKYGAGACTGGSIFVEKNVFRNCVHPVLTSMQGTDISDGKGTFSSEDGGTIKMFDNAIYGGVAVKYSTAGNVSSDTDAYLAATRDEVVPDTYVAKQGGAKYTNFDTAQAMYSYNALETSEVVDAVQKYAGRVENGDFTHEFNDEVDDPLYDRDPVLGGALQSYKSALKTEYATGNAYPGTGGELPTPRPTAAPFDPDAQPTVKPGGGGDPVPSGDQMTEIWRASDNAASIAAGTALKGSWLTLANAGVEYKASNQTIGGVALTGKVNAPSGQTAPTLAENGANGAALQFTPDKDGSVKVYFKLNNGKVFYITDADATEIASHENTTGASQYTTITAEVEAGKTYFAFADGSNAEFWAAEYSYTSDYVDDDPEETQAPDTTQAPTQTPTAIPTAVPTQAPSATSEPVDPSGYVTPATSVDVPTAWSADNITAGTYTAPFELNGLYIGAGDGVSEADPSVLTQQVVIDANSKKIGKTSYTQRIKTGGAGDPQTGIRTFYFKTNGDCDILLHASSSNGSDARDVVVAHGDTAEHLSVLAVDEYRVNDIKAGETVYIYSAGGGLNVYGIQLVEPGYGVLDQKQLPLNTRVTFDVFDGTVITETCMLGDYVKVLYTDGTAPSISTGNKVIGGYSYTKRLGLGGKAGMSGATPNNKAISIIPASDGTLYVDFGSPSSGARTLTVAQGSNKTTGSADTEGGQIAMVVKAGEEVFIYGETETLAVFGIMLIEGGGTDPDSTPAPMPGTVKAVTESTVWTAAIFGVDVATDYTERTLSPDETLALNATAKLPITVDGTKRFKLTGKGREMEIKPGVAGTVTVEFAHASSTTAGTRTLSIVQNGNTVGSKGLEMGETGTAEATVAAGSVIITCDAGVNVTSIIFTPEGETPPVIPTPTPKPTEQPDNRTCVKITATYENGVLKDVEITEDFKVADITTPENTETTKTFYWESLESMKPVTAASAPATQQPTEKPTEKPTPVPVDTTKVVTPESAVDVTNGVVWSANDITQATYKETISLNGLYIGANDSVDGAGKDAGSIVVDSAGTSGKTVGGTKYTNRIKTGGSGNYETGVRCFYFAVSDDCTMLLDAVSSSSSVSRDVVVIHGDTVEHLAVTGTADQYSVSLGKDENVVIYSAEGGLNVYGIKLTTEEPEGGEPEAVTASWTVSAEDIGAASGKELMPGLTTLFANTSTNGKYISSGDNGTLKDGVVTGTALKYAASENGTLKVSFTGLGAGKAIYILAEGGKVGDAIASFTNSDTAAVDGSVSGTVAAGTTYYIYGAGTKARFTAASFKAEAE